MLTFLLMRVLNIVRIAKVSRRVELLVSAGAGAGAGFVSRTSRGLQLRLAFRRSNAPPPGQADNTTSQLFPAEETRSLVVENCKSGEFSKNFPLF
jgi:hypothetical protein